VAGVYITSTGGTYYSGINNYWTSLETSTCTQNKAYMSASLMYIRCMRKDPPVAFPSPTSDTTPVAVTFAPSSSTTAGETRTSNTVTVEGVTAPVTLSVSGGSGAQFSKNGGAYTSASTTVTNGDTVTLRATSPVAGQEDTVSATIGSAGFSWKVRTVANNTIYVFVTSGTWTGNLGGVSGADAKCNAEAAAAGLGGSWIALVATGLGTGNGPAARIPWNWTTLKNMNNATVATSFDDLTDGTISAPINRTPTNGVPSANFVFSGTNVATGKDNTLTAGYDCTVWTSNGGLNFYAGNVNSTNQHFYGTLSSCSSSYALYCMQDPAGGLVDTNPADVGLAPGVAFSAGAAALSNVVTVTGVLQPVTVTVTPSAGTVNIILNGVAQGAGPVTAPPNSTLQFSLTVPAVLGTKNTATIAIGDDSYSWWAGYADSSKQARIFVTSTTGSGNPGGLAGADAYCNTRAAASSLGLPAKWKALISDATVDAANRIPWSWGTLKDVTGTTIVSGGFPDLWDGTLASPVNKNENGGTTAGNVWTGTLGSGVKDALWSGVQTYPYCDNWATPSGGNGAKYGLSSSTTSTWMAFGNQSCGSGTYSFYCFEDIEDTSDTTPNDLSIPYVVQVAGSSRQSSSAVVIAGMSSGATQTLSVTATAGTPTFTVNGGAEVTSASVTNGDSIIFKMDAPAGANAFNKMTITAGSMTSYWRVWTGDPTGSVVKRVFVTASSSSGGLAGVVGADSMCQTAATGAALGGSWKAILSGVGEAEMAVNRIGYNWSELRTVTGTTVVYAPNLWKTATISLLSPIVVNQNGTNSVTFETYSNTKADGSAYSTVADGSNCNNWTTGSGSTNVRGLQTVTNSQWIYQPSSPVSCAFAERLYCIEQ
jgi:hypothetical protein